MSTISTDELRERIDRHFSLKIPTEIDFSERDVRTRSCLVRDSAGAYGFAHESFLAYFVAHRLASAISDSNTNGAIEIWKNQPLSKDVVDILADMVSDPTLFWQLIEATRDKHMNDVGYAGGNAMTLLQYKGVAVAKAQLARTVLAGTYLYNVDLTEVDLQGTCLREAHLINCTLDHADLRHADLTGVRVQEQTGVWALAWSPDAQWLASGGLDCAITIWNTSDWSLQRRLTGHRESIRDLIWSQDSMSIISSSGDDIQRWGERIEKMVRRWDLGEPIIFETLSQGTINRRAIALSADETYLAEIHSGKLVVQRMKATEKHVKALPGDAVDCAFSHQGYRVAIVGSSPAGTSFVEVYDIQSGTPISVIEDLPCQLKIIFFSTDDRWLYAGCADGMLHVWDTLDFLPIRHSRVSTAALTCVACLPGGEKRALGSTTGKIYLYATNDDLLQNRSTSLEQEHTPTSLCFSPDGRYLASGDATGAIRIWDVDASSPTYRQHVKILEVKMSCIGMRIGGARGLDALAQESTDTLCAWLTNRGAVD